MSQRQEAFEKWTKAYSRFVKSGTVLNWPAISLVRMFKGNYITGLKKDYEGKKVLDIGCGAGNNLLFLGTLGLELYGTEVSDEICELTRGKIERFGIKATLKKGLNRDIPFEDNFFDYLVSWNVIHYENNEEDMKKAIAEYARVLKPDGRLFLSTTGPQHMILKGAKLLGNHKYQIGREDDFRKGEVFFYFDTPEYIKFYFSKNFREIYVGRINDFMFTAWQDYFIVTALKQPT